jgi:hypothetical protein
MGQTSRARAASALSRSANKSVSKQIRVTLPSQKEMEAFETTLERYRQRQERQLNRKVSGAEALGQLVIEFENHETNREDQPDFWPQIDEDERERLRQQILVVVERYCNWHDPNSQEFTLEFDAPAEQCGIDARAHYKQRGLRTVSVWTHGGDVVQAQTTSSQAQHSKPIPMSAQNLLSAMKWRYALDDESKPTPSSPPAVDLSVAYI